MSDLNSLTLDDLLNSLGAGLMKAASDDECKDEKKEDKSDKDESKEKKDLPAFMQKKDGDKDEKEDKDEKSEDKEGQTKEASDAGAALAREIMAKVASTKVETINPMNKQASVAGQALAQALLQKKAYAGDMTTENGVVPGTAGSKVIADNAQMEAEGASYIKPMLLSDGIRNSGSLNEIFDAVIADAASQGAAGMEQVHQTGVASQEGNVEDHAVPNQVKVAYINELLEQGMDFDEAAEMVKAASEQEAEQVEVDTDNLEKAAAIQTLVERGVDFEDAVALVKQAAEEIEDEMEKAAALDHLVSQGVDFDEAIQMIKEASAGDMTTQDGVSAGTQPNKNIVDNAQMNGEGDSYIKPMPTGDGIRNSGSLNQIFDAVIADAQSQGAAGTEQVHQTGIASQEGKVEDLAVPNQVKVAAMNRLLEGGFDFDEALAIVKEAGAVGNRLISGGTRLMNAAGRSGSAAVRQAGGHAGAAVRSAGSASNRAGYAADDAVAALKARREQITSKAQSAASSVASTAKQVAGSPLRAKRTAQVAVGRGVQHVQAGAASVAAGAKGLGSQFMNDARGVASGGALQVNAAGKVGNSRMQHLKGLATNPLTMAGAGAAALGGGAYALGREKKAAFDALVEGGVDFDTAAALVSAKAKELYGE